MDRDIIRKNLLIGLIGYPMWLGLHSGLQYLSVFTTGSSYSANKILLQGIDYWPWFLPVLWIYWISYVLLANYIAKIKISSNLKFIITYILIAYFASSITIGLVTG